MNNYYDLLNISQEASQSEIETVLDDQYTKWRALVTHHDNNVVAQANQALNQLEEIRNTLMNPEKRRAYNNRLLASQGNVAGLADPDILLAQKPVGHVMAPPRPRVSESVQATQAEMDRTDAWICTNPNCKKANPIGTQFCVKCGTRIGLECPSCGEFVEISNKFCSSCGVNKAEFFEIDKEEKIHNFKEQIMNIRAEIQEAEANPKGYSKKNKGSILSKVGLKYDKSLNITGLLAPVGMIMILIGGCGEKWALFTVGVIVSVLGLIVLFGSINNAQKNQLPRYIEDYLKPRIEELRKNISDIQTQRYGS